MHIIEDHAQKANIPLRFAASKIAEGDTLIIDQLDLDINEKRTLAHIVKQMEAERGLDPPSPTCAFHLLIRSVAKRW